MTDKERHDDLSRFGKSFQEKLCQLILQDRPFSEQIEEVFETTFLELKYLQVFVSLVFNYRKKYEIHPSVEIISSLLNTEIESESEVVQGQTRDFFARITASKRVDDAEYVKQISLDFCKKQKLKAAMLRSVELLQSSSFDQIKSEIDTALKLGLDNNCGHDFVVDFEARYVDRPRQPVSTGWPEIDDITGGGHGRGELGVVIASTGSGKSMALVHLGAQALLQGKNVIYYTLELDELVVGKRFDSCITGISLNDLALMKKEVLDVVRTVPGELIIKEYPTKSASTNTIRQHLQKLKMRDKKVDMIIVDYGDLLRPTRTYEQKRMELETIYEELRGLAKEFNCPIWTASQTNRSGLNAEVVTLEAISEAFNKCFVSDFIFTISRTIDDKNNNTGRIFIAKNRNGQDGLIMPIFMDTSKVAIKVLGLSSESIEDFAEKAAEKQKEHLSELYLKFKEQNKNVKAS